MRWTSLAIDNLRTACLAIIAVGCGSPSAVPIDTGVDTGDAPMSTCQPIGAVGDFVRRAGNPQLLPVQSFSDGKIDTSIADPDVHWDPVTQTYELYYMGEHTVAFDQPGVQSIRHASSPDHQTWTVDDAPVLTANPDVNAWDHTNTETPSIAINPDAAPDHRYLLMYSGAAALFPYPGYNNAAAYSIGAAFSADGIHFTRVPAADSPHGQDGLVLLASDIYATTGAIVADPEVVYANGLYHLWFTSFGCNGTTCATKVDYGIGHSTSPDGIHWTTQEAPVRSLLRSSADLNSGGSQPSVIYDADRCRWELWMTSDASGETDAQPAVFNNMAGVWHADSTDAVTWHVSFADARDLAWNATAPGEHLGLLTGADVAANGSGRLMLYVGLDDQNVPPNFYLPDHTSFRPGVMALDAATRDLP